MTVNRYVRVRARSRSRDPCYDQLEIKASIRGD